MNLFNKTISGILVSLTISVGATASASDGQARNFYPLPIAELREVTTNWLDQAGYDVAYRELEMGIIQLTCSRNSQNWIIILRPQSALATELTVKNAENKSNSVGFEEEISAYINTYLNPIMGDDKKSVGNSKTPAAVSSKSDAVVCIQTEFNQTIIQFSGFIINSTGAIICTTHGLRQFRTIKITDNRGQEYGGELIKFDTEKDLALIQTTMKPRIHLSFVKSRQSLLKGSQLYSIGCPVNHNNKVTVGSITQPPVKADDLVYWQVNMEIRSGSSGSPVFDSQGELVGMIKGRYRGNNGIGFLIPMDRIKTFINES